MASSFGELVLVLGDLHIPQRAPSIPDKFKRMLVPNKMSHVICTGNLGSAAQYDVIRGLAPNVHVVAGDCDGGRTGLGPFPDSRVVSVGEFRIGVTHGHGEVPWGDPATLSMLRRRLGCDILITGHTHRNEVRERDGFYHINPGSITGAGSAAAYGGTDQAEDVDGGGGGVTPSFVLLAVTGSKCVCYLYELVDGEVDVSKTEFTKSENRRSEDP